MKASNSYFDSKVFDLDRFLIAQSHCFEEVLNEMNNGKKVSHWMWYFFPQIAGLGKSETSRKYQILNIQEAKQYLKHPILGSRLLLLSKILVDDINNKTAFQIFGSPDDLKLHSSMTLFHFVVISNPSDFSLFEYSIFSRVIARYFSNVLDVNTIHLLSL
jgi:uncharacterized protein (DUF1810 family)